MNVSLGLVTELVIMSSLIHDSPWVKPVHEVVNLVRVAGVAIPLGAGVTPEALLAILQVRHDAVPLLVGEWMARCMTFHIKIHCD